MRSGSAALLWPPPSVKQSYLDGDGRDLLPSPKNLRNDKWRPDYKPYAASSS
jgi:hypothetical protein